MRDAVSALFIFCLSCAVFCGCDKETNATDTQTYAAKGIVKELEPDGKTVVISHEAISNYMAAMTMPFEVRDTNELHGLSAGDSITFRLVVTPTHGWIENIVRIDVPKRRIRRRRNQQTEHLELHPCAAAFGRRRHAAGLPIHQRTGRSNASGPISRACAGVYIFFHKLSVSGFLPADDE